MSEQAGSVAVASGQGGAAALDVERARTRARSHVPKKVMSADVAHRVHGTGPVGRFNSRLAVIITRSVGTMWAAYVFAVLALVSFPEAWAAFQHGDTLVGITWLSQSFLQLVLLPIIIVGQNVISEAQDARAEADHETLLSLHTMNVQQLEILENQRTMIANQHAMLEEIRRRPAASA